MPFSLRPHRCMVLAYLSGFWSLILLMALSRGPASAEWVFVSGDDDAGMTVYVDPDTIRRQGDFVTDRPPLTGSDLYVRVGPKGGPYASQPSHCRANHHQAA